MNTSHVKSEDPVPYGDYPWPHRSNGEKPKPTKKRQWSEFIIGAVVGFCVGLSIGAVLGMLVSDLQPPLRRPEVHEAGGGEGRKLA